MSDTQVTIGFGGTTTEFEAACQRASLALRGLLDTTNTFTAGLQATTQGLNATTPAVNAVTQATTQAATALRQVSPVTKAVTSDLQALVNATTGVNRESRSAAESADVFRQALGDQSNEVKALKSQFDNASEAATKTGHSSNGITRELIVLGHEAMNGQFSRFAGSLLVMGELLSSISSKMGIIAVGILAVGAAVYHLAKEMREARTAADALNASMVLIGRDPIVATANAAATASALRSTAQLGKTVAREVAAEFEKVPDATAETRKGLALLVPALHAGNPDEPIEKLAAQFAKTASSIGGIKTFLEENRMLMNVSMREEFDALVKNGDLRKAQLLLLERTQARTADYTGFLERQRAAAQAEGEAQNAGLAGMWVPPKPPEIPRLRMTEAAPDPDQARLDDDIAKANVRRREALELDRQLHEMRERLAHTTNASDRESIEYAIKATEQKRLNLRDAGDTTWFEAQRLALTKEDALVVAGAKTHHAATEAKLVNEVQFWSKVLQGTELSVTQRAHAEEGLAKAQERLTMERLSEADRASRAGSTAARKGTQEQVAELSAQQAANRDDYEKWWDLEQQKLAILRTAYGEKSKEFQAELRAEETYQRQHVARLEQLELQKIDAENQVGQRRLTERVSRLAAEVAQQMLGKSEELAIARQATEAEGSVELAKLDNFISTLREGTAEYQKAMLQREKLYQDFQNKIAVIDTRMAENNRRVADRMQQPYAHAFESITAASEHMAVGLATGTLTWQRAQQQMASAVVQSFVGMVGQVLARWAAKEAFQTATSQAGVTARTALENGDAVVGVIGKYLASWLGLETGKTAATTGGTAARTGVETAASVEGAIIGKGAALSQIMANAAVAASAAFAATAAIPFIGPELAPAAAAAAFAETASWAGAVAIPSFAVGAWSLPSDMLAQVHKGEMIVPAFQADAMRNGASLGGGSTALHVTINAIDTQSGAAFLNQQLPFLAKRLDQHRRLNGAAT